ncbi:hypothetical protein LINGRAHAP2_LOCUS28460 [Linum grandiflorum]
MFFTRLVPLLLRRKRLIATTRSHSNELTEFIPLVYLSTCRDEDCFRETSELGCFRTPEGIHVEIGVRSKANVAVYVAKEVRMQRTRLLKRALVLMFSSFEIRSEDDDEECLVIGRRQPSARAEQLQAVTEPPDPGEA